MDRQDDEVHRRAGMTAGRQRRVDRPSGSGAERAGFAFDEHRGEQKRERGRQQPERNVVHARERHVGRPDHDRHEPVAEASDHRRHHHEEDHDQAVRGGEHVVFMRAREELQTGILQFEPDADRQQAADDAGDQREGQVHGADVFVVRRIDKPAPSGGMVIVGIMRFMCAVCSRIARHRYCPSTLVVIGVLVLCAILSENRFPLFGIMHSVSCRWPRQSHSVERCYRRRISSSPVRAKRCIPSRSRHARRSA